MTIPKDIKKINDVTWEIPTSYKKGMRVPARIIATKELLEKMDDGVFDQVTNVATLPGIVKYAICHADGHWGYGFPIGGVAAFDLDEGVISPGGIGFDINCGMRLLKTNLTFKDIEPKIKELTHELFKQVPPGVGAKSLFKPSKKEFSDILKQGAQWCVQNGYGWKEDLESIEDYGKIDFADTTKVSEKALSRGINQIGTLGSGNHYLEVQTVSQRDIFDKELAKQLGVVKENQVMVMVHCGSRGFGHQVATDYLRVFEKAMQKYDIHVPDKELACAPFKSQEGQDYYKAMACAGNYAYANRQMITHHIRKAFSNVLKKDARELGMDLIYDNTHNLARKHKVLIDGKQKEVLVHLKGATTSAGPGYPRLTKKYRDVGSLIILGGSMETGSYLLRGTKTAEEETFASTAHGSGRTMSRAQAKRTIRGDKLQQDMERRGIYVKAVSMSGLAEEAGIAYKEIDEVVSALDKANISKPIMKLRPRANVKG